MKSFDLVQIKSTAKSADFPHFFEGDFRWVFVHGTGATLLFVQRALRVRYLLIQYEQS